MSRDAELARAVHLNMLAFFRRSAERTDAGALEEANGAVTVTLGTPLPFLNCVIPVDEARDPAALLERADDFFAGRSAGWVVFTREGDPADDALRAACDERVFGFQPRYPELVADERVAEPDPPAGCELQTVEDEEGARTYWELCNRSYVSLGFAPDNFSNFPSSLLLEDETRAVIAYRDGTPVACALGFLPGDGITCVGWVATVEEARGTGLGALVTARVTNDGFDRGARLASLQASPMGLSVYLRLGYREIANYNVHARLY